MRSSKQRDAVLQVVKAACDHPTADMIFERVREQIPNISLGTVYRNLSELSASGDILAFKAFDGSEHYDATCEPHPHLCCTACRQIVDLDIPFVDDFTKKSANHTGAEIESHNIVFYGKCSDCCKSKMQ